jgi:hypothetical protein
MEDLLGRLADIPTPAGPTHAKLVSVQRLPRLQLDELEVAIRQMKSISAYGMQ